MVEYEDKDEKDVIGAEQFFTLLERYLRALRIDRAKEVIFTGNGAAWIWNRARTMLTGLGVREDRIVEVVDWWHTKQAVWKLSEKSTLGQAASLLRRPL